MQGHLNAFWELNLSIGEATKDLTFYDSMNVVLETMNFFNGNCLQASRINQDRINSMRASYDYQVESAHIAAAEWSVQIN